MYTHVYMYVYIHAYIYISIQYIGIYNHICKCGYIYACICTYIHMCICVYAQSAEGGGLFASYYDDADFMGAATISEAAHVVDFSERFLHTPLTLRNDGAFAGPPPLILQYCKHTALHA